VEEHIMVTLLVFATIALFLTVDCCHGHARVEA
jgi:hypothetical protein